jgi:hypothetical protein
MAMDPSANVRSIDAIREFREALLVFCAEAREALTTVDMQSRRALEWIQHGQPAFWRTAIRRTQEELTKAKADLFRKQLERISGEKPDCLEEHKAVRLSKSRLEHAEERLEKCRHWGNRFPKAIDEYAAPARNLAALVEGDPPAIVLLLDRITATLDAYVDLAPPEKMK